MGPMGGGLPPGLPRPNPLQGTPLPHHGMRPDMGGMPPRRLPSDIGAMGPQSAESMMGGGAPTTIATHIPPRAGMPGNMISPMPSGGGYGFGPAGPPGGGGGGLGPFPTPTPGASPPPLPSRVPGMVNMPGGVPPRGAMEGGLVGSPGPSRIGEIGGGGGGGGGTTPPYPGPEPMPPETGAPPQSALPPKPGFNAAQALGRGVYARTPRGASGPGAWGTIKPGGLPPR